ncbi:hypothetical protein SCA6_004595, partial [Theobroma cacao]
MDKLFNAMLLLLTLFTEIALLCSCQNASFSCIQSERQALLKLKQSFSDSSHCLSSWKGKNCCMWKGVSCDENNGHVVKLNLRAGSTSWLDNGSSLRAREVNSYITELRYLKYLDLSGNDFQDSAIPQFFSLMKQLRYLNISDAGFSGSVPQNLGNLTSLRVLDLSTEHRGSTLRVDDIQWISHLVSLQQLGMAGIHLGEARNLFQITGSIPNFSSNLMTIDLSNNLISGTLTEMIGDNNVLSKLQSLILSDNRVNGSIPNSFCHIETLEVLQLSKNKLSANIPDCWRDYQSLQVLDLSSNNLSGVIPSSIGHLNSLQWLHLSNNSLSGEPPLALKNCRDLVVLDLGENALSGHVPKWIGDGFWQLSVLRLRKNKFSGTIPSQLCHISTLQILDLAENNLKGKIPYCFADFIGMVKTDVGDLEGYSGNFLTQWNNEHLTEVIKGRSLEYTKTLRFLVSMDLSSNKLEGSIPEELALLTGLIGLNLSHNQLSGQFPNKIGKLESLESLDLSFNELSGMIP